MGRTDAVAFTNQWAARARQLGAIVHFEPGWDSRGNGMAANYEGAIVHHTTGVSSPANPFPTRNVLINGRPDLRGPLCNVAAPWCPPDSPRLVVISARPANHAGASGGRSMGPLPVTAAFNARVFGLEIDYAGLVPMAPGQYRAALIFARAVADVLGRSVEYIRAHGETSITGKWDPGYANGKTIDMAAFRRDAANLQEDDMPTASEIAEAVWSYPVLRGGVPGGRQPAIQELANTGTNVLTLLAENARLRAALSAAQSGDQVDLAAVQSAARAGAEEALAKGVDVDITVGGDRPSA